MLDDDGAPRDREIFVRVVKESLVSLLGKSAAATVLHYIGEPDPSTFETKLHAFFGKGAVIIMQTIEAKMGKRE